jgi:hypothetical protein
LCTEPCRKTRRPLRRYLKSWASAWRVAILDLTNAVLAPEQWRHILFLRHHYEVPPMIIEGKTYWMGIDVGYALEHMTGRAALEEFTEEDGRCCCTSRVRD